MTKDQFVVCMMNVHNVLFYVHGLKDKQEHEYLIDLINTYISMMAGFHEALYNVLKEYLITHRDVTEEDLEDLYDILTSEPMNEGVPQ